MKDPMEATLQRNIFIAIGILSGMKQAKVASKFNLSVAACRGITTRMVRRVDEPLFDEYMKDKYSWERNSVVIPMSFLLPFKNRLIAKLSEHIDMSHPTIPKP